MFKEQSAIWIIAQQHACLTLFVITQQYKPCLKCTLAEVPLLPAADAEDSCRVPPFLFMKTSESTFFAEGSLRLTCPIAGADFVNKLIAVDPAAKAAAKKRAKCPDLSEEPEAKKQKKAAKSKASARPKGKAKAKPEDSIVQETTASAAALEADVSFQGLFARSSDLEGSRPRRWMDDLLACLEKANGKQLDAFDETMTAKTTLVGSLISMGLEFALTGKLVVGKKTFKDWSKAMRRHAGHEGWEHEHEHERLIAKAN